MLQRSRVLCRKLGSSMCGVQAVCRVHQSRSTGGMPGRVGNVKVRETGSGLTVQRYKCVASVASVGAQRMGAGGRTAGRWQ
jgi:hypothetical protein